MTAAELSARKWCGAACAAAQIAATAAGMVPWWGLPFTLALTVAVSLPTGPVDQLRARLTRIAGVASVAAFTTIIAMRAISEGKDGFVNPTATLRSLTEALVVLSLIMAPNARTPREHRVWLTVTLGVLVAAAAGGHTVGQGVMILASWVVVLIATNRVQVTDAYSGGAVTGVVVGARAEPPRSLLRYSDTVVPIVSTLLVGAIVLVTVPSGLGGTDLARRIARSVQRANLQLADRDSVGVDTRGFGDLSLLVRGELPDTPIIRVPSSSPELWRATFYRQYTGTEWTNVDTGTFQGLPGSSVKVPSFVDDPPAVRGVTRTDQVEVAPGAEASLVWAPGVARHVTASATEVRGVLRGPANVRLLGSGRPLTSYTVRSVVPTSSRAVLSDARGADPTDPAWTALPSELPPEVATLARQITAGASNRFEAVRAVESYLRQHEKYTLDTPIPRRGTDAVDEFLFHTHVGFCELFASAEAVLLRSVGVPTRLVSGLAYGTPQGKTRLFTAKNAHAWDEVYYPGVGWSPSDPTAGVSLAGDVAAGRSILSQAFDKIAKIIPGGRLVLAVIGAALFVVLGWVVRQLLRGQRLGRSRHRASRPPGPVLAAFLKMAKSRHGPPPRAPAETPRQYLSRVGGTRPDVDAAVLALEQELYGEGAPTDAEVRAAIEIFDSLATPAP
jgi:transglutaminase-like putative cysteine protease